MDRDTRSVNVRQTRRGMMQMAGIWIAAGALAGSEAADAAPRALLRLVGDRHSAETVGRAYLAGHAASQGIGDLCAAIMSSLQLDDAALRNLDRKTLQRLFRYRVQQEFAKGNVVSVQGWILSRVEAQVCALARLSKLQAA
jgi:hypothetical protein